MTVLNGIDISHHQATTPDLTGIDFVIVRACYGSTPDELYATHAAAVRAAGLILGAYAFLRPASVAGETTDAQVAAFLATAPDADFWVVDREADGTLGTITTTDLRKVIKAVQATGRRCGLYMSESPFTSPNNPGMPRDYGQDFSWVANYSREPLIAYDLWQSRGSPLDLDVFRGTPAALRALGAPRKEWVDAQLAALTTRAEAAEAQAASLANQLTAANVQIGTLTDLLAAADSEITTAATAWHTLTDFAGRHA